VRARRKINIELGYVGKKPTTKTGLQQENRRSGEVKESKEEQGNAGEG